MTVTLSERPPAQPSPWFVSWFDSIHYRKLYAYRDDTEAAGFIDVLLEHLRPASGSVALDLGCGIGRHSRYLATKGLRVTGIDLAANSIQQAKRFEQSGLHFLQHDMRASFGKNAVDYLFNFFTSFGYFEDPAEYLMVIRNMADALKSEGRLVLDYLNVGYAEAHTIPREVRIIDGTTYRLTRWSDASHFFKQIVVEDPDGGESGEYLEHVAKFSVDDFRRMFDVHGLNIDGVYGDYRLSPYDPDMSPRMILVARKTRPVRNSIVWHQAETRSDTSEWLRHGIVREIQ
jgi:2-polyprenyl-3-methyl-5-hydroxy-6-metoxy-1,4-benzoquinol methylase